MKMWIIILGVLLAPSGAWAICEVVAPAATYATGSTLADPPCGTTGGQRSELSTLLAGENQTLNEIYTSNSGIPVRYTTTGDKNVKASAGELVQIMASSGTSVTAVIYDDADGTCSSGQISGTIALTNGTPVPTPYRFNTGICITVGGTNPDLTVVYK